MPIDACIKPYTFVDLNNYQIDTKVKKKCFKMFTPKMRLKQDLTSEMLFYCQQKVGHEHLSCTIYIKTASRRGKHYII